MYEIEVEYGGFTGYINNNKHDGFLSFFSGSIDNLRNSIESFSYDTNQKISGLHAQFEIERSFLLFETQAAIESGAYEISKLTTSSFEVELLSGYDRQYIQFPYEMTIAPEIVNLNFLNLKDDYVYAMHIANKSSSGFDLFFSENLNNDYALSVYASINYSNLILSNSY